MKNSTITEEEKLINEHIDLERKIHYYEMEKPYCKETFEIRINEENTTKAIFELEKVKEKLVTIIEKPISQNIFDNLIFSYNQMIKIVSNIRINLPISKSQGTIFDNYFATIIFEQIRKAVYMDSCIISTPFLYITSDPNDGFNRHLLIDFFENERNLLKEIQTLNYISIRKYFSDFSKRIGQLE